MKETLTSYRWPEDSVIRRIDVRAQKNGRAVAYLYADDSEATRQQRLDIRAAIRLKGWGTLSDHRGGEFGLRVSGLRNGDELVQALQTEGFVSAPSQQATLDEETKEPLSSGEKIKSNSLQWSGILASIGNAIGIARGVHNRQVAARIDGTQAKQWGEIGKGLAFAAADLPLAIAGGQDDARQLGDFLRRLKNHYDKEGIEIPRTASIYVETSNNGKSIGELSMDFMHRYANQIKCGFEVVAAFLSIKGGHEQDLWPKRVAPFFWGAGFAASGLIPERKIDPEKYVEAGLLGRLWMKIQANPLILGGTLGWTNNAADYYSAKIGHDRWKAEGRTGTPLWMWDIATPTSMIGANGLYAISKKTVGGDIKSDAMVSDAYTVAAQIINKQPENLREKAIESTAKFFAERTEIKENHAEVLARLREEISLQRKNPWFEPLGLPPYVPKPKRGLHHETAPVPGTATAEADAAPAPDAATPLTTVSGRELAYAGHNQAATLAQEVDERHV